MAKKVTPDKCPRCASVVTETGLDEWTCAKDSCLGFWASARGWERECVARDIAGTRVKISEQEWLEGKGAGSLRGDLHDLATLARVAAFTDVRTALLASLEGREAELEREGNRSPRFHQLVHEIGALGSMQTWVENQMRAASEQSEDE